LLDHVLAGSLLEYRVNHRAGAALKARSYNNCSSTATTGSPGGNCGYIGTMFPWESAFTGLEVGISLLAHYVCVLSDAGWLGRCARSAEERAGTSSTSRAT